MIPTLPLLKTPLQHPSNLPRLPTLPTALSVLRPVSKPVSQPFKRSQWGLFDGKSKRYGNNVPHSKHKTRRTWMPNIQTQTLWSESINGGRGIKVRVTARAGRSIKKVSGRFLVSLSLSFYLFCTK
jgi:ribosomal protein L28